jgi:hypothetical protein
MKATSSIILFVVFYCGGILAQPDALRGPQNVLPEGVIDGVVVKDELPVRSRVEYEHVRLSDYVWSKRLYSRIDQKEKVNYPLFMPYDYFPDLGWNPPKSPNELDKSDWIRNQDRYSLWTIIMKHTFSGNLTIYEVSDSAFSAVEDGYSLKYPLKPNGLKTNLSYFNDLSFRKKVNQKFSFGGIGPKWTIDRPVTGDNWSIIRSSSNESFDDWFVRLTTKGDSVAQDPSDYEPLTREPKEMLRESYNGVGSYGLLRRPDVVKFISSQTITAYNIKEDWFFDKERSMLDKRIIAIAPVARMKPMELDDPNEVVDDGIDRYKNLIGINRNGFKEEYDTQAGIHSLYDGPVIEQELFWLYFPELRNVMVNYYVYNNQSDAQWMSFDDFFWKRMFSGTIYRASDQFDRDVEDYRYGVDALYEAEKIKENMRTWETDLWNY